MIVEDSSLDFPTRQVMGQILPPSHGNSNSLLVTRYTYTDNMVEFHCLSNVPRAHGMRSYIPVLVPRSNGKGCAA